MQLLDLVINMAVYISKLKMTFTLTFNSQVDFIFCVTEWIIECSTTVFTIISDIEII